MKKFLSSILTIVMLLSVVPLGAVTVGAEVTCGTTGDCTWSMDENVLIISGNGNMGNSSAKPWGKYITEVIIKDGVTNIGKSAFSGCLDLKSVTIPNSVTSIGSHAFASCQNLENITIPNSVTSIGDYVFYDCHSITSIAIPNKVTNIGEHTFSGCHSLKNVIIPNGVTSIGDGAFWSCRNLLNVTIPNSITNIGIQAFNYCQSITSIDIPNSITSISDYAFAGCYNLENITIPNSVTSIGSGAFVDCYSLKNVTIPNSVTKIYAGAFSGCKSLTNVEVSVDNSAFSSDEGVLFNKDKTSLICYPAAKTNTNYIIPDSVTSILSYSFRGCVSLKSVTIPNSITSIEDYTFSYCKSLESLIIPNSVTGINEGAFSSCESLQNITIPDNVTSIGLGAFSYCTSLKSVEISNNVRIINSWAFDECSSLTSISIPDSVTNIYSWAFSECSSLKSVEIGNNVAGISNWAFFQCSSLVNVTIPKSVIGIGTGAFADCESLTNVEVSVDNSAFSSDDGVLFNKDKTSLICYPAGKRNTSYIIPDSVSSINSWAFWQCSRLVNVTIPNSVTSIGQEAFRHCSSFTNVTIPNSVTHIGDYAFSGCGSLKSITVPNSVTSIGQFAFSSTMLLYGYKTCAAFVEYGAKNKNYIIYLDCTDEENIIGGKVGNCNWSLNKLTGELAINGTGKMVDFTSYNSTPWYQHRQCITKVKLSNGVTSIGDKAFEICSNLIDVTTDNSLTSIGEYAFSYCESLKNIELSNRVTNIDIGAFYHCTNLQNVTIPNSVSNIGAAAFYRCTSIKNITIPYEVNNIYSYTFFECTNLKKVYIYNKNCTIDSDCGLNYNNTIYGFVGSTAETFANKIGAKFIDIMTVHSHTYDNACDTNCNECGTTRTVNHTYKTITTKATTSKNGNIVNKCKICSKVKNTTIYYPKSIKLSTTKYIYDGKTKKPSVKIYDSKGNKLKYGTDYTYSRPKSSKKIGEYTIKVIFKGKYSGSKKLYYKINPRGTFVSILTAKKKSLKVVIKKQSSQITGYQVKYSTSKKFTNAKTKTIKGYKTISYTIKSLKAKKTYYIKVRTYKIVNGKKLYSDWSDVVRRKTK